MCSRRDVGVSEAESGYAARVGNPGDVIGERVTSADSPIEVVRTTIIGCLLERHRLVRPGTTVLIPNTGRSSTCNTTKDGRQTNAVVRTLGQRHAAVVGSVVVERKLDRGGRGTISVDRCWS